MFPYHFILAFPTFLGDIFTFCGDFFWRDLLAMVIFEVTPISKLYLGQFSLELSKWILKLLIEAVFCFKTLLNGSLTATSVADECGLAGCVNRFSWKWFTQEVAL